MLSLGPKFVVKQKPKLVDMLAAIQRLQYAIKWRHFLRATPNNNIGFMRFPYEREFCKPPPIDDADEAHRVKIMVQRLTAIATKTCSANSKFKSNLTSSETRVLKELRTKDMVFLPSDKGGELTTQQYNTAAFNHLNSDVYKQVSKH